MWAVRFADPWWGLAMILVAAPPVAGLWTRRRGRRVSWLSVVLQCLAVAAVGGALTRPEVSIPLGQPNPCLVLTDASASVRGQWHGELSWKNNDVPIEYLYFADSLATEAESLDETHTRVSGALRLAAARADELSGVVLLSDGQFHDEEEWPAAGAALADAGVDVFVVPMDSPPPDARISRFGATRLANGRVQWRVTVTSNTAADRTLTIRRDGATGPLLERTLCLQAGESTTFHVTGAAPLDRLVSARAYLSTGDKFPQNDSAVATLTPSAQRVGLIAARDAPLPASLATSLELPIEHIRPADAPTTTSQWSQLAAVILVDAEGELLEPAARASLAESVRNGGGLVLIGAGPHARPSDRNDPINRVSALLANPYERHRLDIVVLLDASGSMALGDDPAGRTRFQQAAGATVALEPHLTSGDTVSVITFRDRPKLIYDSGDSPADFAALAGALGEVTPAGPTQLAPALALAASRDVKPQRDGLILLISDLKTASFDADRAADELRRAGFGLAVVAVSSQGAPPAAGVPLETLVQRMGASFVQRTDMVGLADVFARFVRDARGPDVRRGRWTVQGSPALFGLAITDLPDVDAYILSTGARDADVLARARGDPIIASRPVGLGRSVSLAIPMTPGNNHHWQRWDHLDRFLAAAVRSVLRRQADPRFTGQVDRDGGELHLRLHGDEDGQPVNLLQLTAVVIAPDDATVESPVLQVAPGVYEGHIAAGDDASTVVVRDSAGTVVWRRTLEHMYPHEFAGIGANWDNLRRLVELSGARMVSVGELPVITTRLHRSAYRAVWPALLAIGLGIMLGEWLTKRR